MGCSVEVSHEKRASREFEEETALPIVDHLTMVPDPVHGGHECPIEVWPDISESNLANAASHLMEAPCAIYQSTPRQTAHVERKTNKG
jgi:hypothetical protein